jgi:hypothetical protein
VPGKRVRQLRFNAMSGSSMKVDVVVSLFHPPNACSIARLQDKEPGDRWRSQVSKDAEDVDVPHTIYQKIVTRPEATILQHLATEALWIAVDVLLTKVLQSPPRTRIATASCDLRSQKVTESSAPPAERVGHCCAH